MLPVPKGVRGECSEGSLKLVERQEEEGNSSYKIFSPPFSLPSASTVHIRTLHH